MQILEDGCLTDAKGRKVNFSNTIVILTSNLGAAALQKQAGLGFEIAGDREDERLEDLQAKNEVKVKSELRQFMKPELLNRLDQTIVFKTLSPKDILKIVDVQLAELEERLAEQKLGLVVKPEARKWLAEHGYDQKNGVRPLRRLIQSSLENKIAEGLLAGDFSLGDAVAAGLGRGPRDPGQEDYRIGPADLSGRAQPAGRAGLRPIRNWKPWGPGSRSCGLGRRRGAVPAGRSGIPAGS